MVDSRTFAVDLFRTIAGHLGGKAVELGFLAEAELSFEDWLKWEAYLGCKRRQKSYPFCEVAIMPTYASEGVALDDSSECVTGDLRVGGPNDGAHHCWAFIEFALLQGQMPVGDAMRKLEASIERLKKLGWKKSAALLIVVAVGTDDVAIDGLGNVPALTSPLLVALPNGGKMVLKAFDIKNDPSHTLTTEINAPLQ